VSFGTDEIDLLARESINFAQNRRMSPVGQTARRQFLYLAVGAAALPVASRIAWGQAYPTRPVHWIVGFPAGSGPDIAVRLMGQWLSERLGQQVVVEDRPGAGGTIATEAVVRAAPDGYSLLCATAANAVNATLYENLKFDFVRDIAPVASHW
jgi:tripartite-type tricarboxylate transporter receptor subunit TctC